MAKRFTDTEKWNKPWYRKLGTEGRDLWNYIHENCDFAGIFDIDCEKISFVLGFHVTEEAVFAALRGKYTQIKPGKIFIPQFVKFQYGEVSELSRPHKAVIKRLRDERVWEPFSKGMLTLTSTLEVSTKDKDQDKNKDQDKDQNKDPKKLTPDDVVQTWNDSMGKDFGYCPGLGCNEHLKNCLESLKFMPTKENWINLFERCLTSELLTGKSKSSWTVNLLWLVNYDNALKVLSDSFDDQKMIRKMHAEAEAIINGEVSA